MNQQNQTIFKKSIKTLSSGIIHVQSTFNNTIITITDIFGNTVSSASAGSVGFKGTRKATSFAAQLACQKAVNVAKNFGLKKVEIWLKGQGTGREITIKTIKNLGLEIIVIKDITRVPHNGCRPSKKRRI
jgi:small subunit ribosomal protein S11